MPSFDLEKDIASGVEMLTRLLYLARQGRFEAMCELVAAGHGRATHQNLVGVLNLLASRPEIPGEGEGAGGAAGALPDLTPAAS